MVERSNLISTLARFGFDADARPALNPMLHRAALTSARALGVSHGKVMCYRPDHGDLLIVAGIGWRPGIVGHATLSIDSASPPGRTLQTAQPVAIPDLRAQGTFRYPDILQDHGIVASLNVPVQVDGRVWGILEVDHVEAREFGAEEIEFLCVMALLLGRPIRRERMTQRILAADHAKAEMKSRYETLLREAEHRVKNNLQVINSVLALEQKKVANASAKQSFQNVMDRVTAVGLAHDQLSLLQAGEKLDLGNYLRAVCTSLANEHSARITITDRLDSWRIPADRAVPFGLILNEAVTNAAKYAYPSGKQGPVAVVLSLDHDSAEGSLEVRDEGVGDTPPGGSGSGGQLMEALARQLGGCIEIESTGSGRSVRLVFPTSG